ncbi:Acetyltransferase involved in cellulose biosynthesis, CelD/BcsL family [Devosia lucknowensis]|uniref:Acetyltransferase involved in cellulose biosynthesis, CelD/BcsL family n=1 Tax=Devosia lucknowensis TaxID=1096929 RepID=A0A1Y6EYT5_9HYPH|nr:GNAT family N-acetyltransferase [Devosia lucknowensis]SMQ66230.1 Acetyltransferase involved in cellulose biosynthesis, CelD/BcsL family [Devosia lucknowensis]
MSANSLPVAGMADQIELAWHKAVVAAEGSACISVAVHHRIADVEAPWRALSTSIDSPGQNYDFIRLWVENRKIPEDSQVYVVGRVGGEPIAILPLHRKRVFGIRVFTWFPGSHAGCYAPVADTARLAAMGAEGRAALWRQMLGSVKGAGLAYLRSIPASVDGQDGLFDQLGSSLAVDTLYRVQFSSWEQCDAEQRSRSRRKHDRQQGDRLAALGAVDFEEISDPAEAQKALAIMFEQRSARFRAQGIHDPFVAENLIGFYSAALERSSGVDVRLHALRLDGEIVAVRYNVVHGDRMFCLISSMSDCERIQGGSPGKQCLLRVMQTVFGQGIAIFDMGCGYTDEKRHWCNVQIPLRHHYVGLSPVGKAVALAHRSYQRLRAQAKSNDRIKGALRALKQQRDRLLRREASDQL